MIVEVFINSAWRRLTWRQGDTPVVRNEYEPSRLFLFVAPMATLSIYDRDGTFRQGGSLEIKKDQEVRIFSGQGSIEIFRGVIDRDIRFTPADETLRFNAVGWLARIKRYLAGRHINRIAGDNALDSDNRVIGSIADDTWALRYIREFDDVDGIATVEVVYPNTFNNLLPENLKVSLRKRHVFDSRLFDPNFNTFQTENEDIFVFTEGGFRGLFTRLKNDGFFKSVPFSVIVDELVRQINIRLSEFTSNVSTGEITGNLNIRLIDNVFGTMDYFTRFLNDETRLFAIGWGTNDGLPLNKRESSQQIGVAYGGGGGGGIGAGITVYNIINKFDPIIKNNDADFSGGWQEALFNGYPGTLENLELPTPPTKKQQRSLVITRVNPADDDRFVTIYMVWSWLDQLRLGGGPQFTLIKKTMAQWHTFDLVNGTLVGGGAHFVEGRRFFVVNGYPLLDKSIIINEPFRFVRGGAQFKKAEVPSISTELDSQSGTHYSIIDGVPFASGNLTFESMQFDFTDTPAIEVFLEICKLTNSVLYIDKDKVINIVSRDFSVDAHILGEDVVIQTTSQVTSNFGERIPSINSDIVVQPALLSVLQDFYANQEFPKIEDKWVLRLLENDTTASIKLLDTVKFPKIGLGDNITPAIVRSVEVREGEIKMTVTRAQ